MREVIILPAEQLEEFDQNNHRIHVPSSDTIMKDLIVVFLFFPSQQNQTTVNRLRRIHHLMKLLLLQLQS